MVINWHIYILLRIFHRCNDDDLFERGTPFINFFLSKKGSHYTAIIPKSILLTDKTLFKWPLLSNFLFFRTFEILHKGWCPLESREWNKCRQNFQRACPNERTISLSRVADIQISAKTLRSVSTILNIKQVRRAVSEEIIFCLGHS